MKKLIALLLLMSFITGCAGTVLKAPCNATGSNCGQRIKINQWADNN